MNEYYTLTSYFRNQVITYAMEDYLEMLYRQKLTKITITNLSKILNIKKSSCSKMINKLINLELVSKENNLITLTTKGNKIYKRHLILTIFLKKLNTNHFKLEQVEKIEHFIDSETLNNIYNLILKGKL